MGNGTTQVPAAQLGNTPSARSVSGPTSPPTYTPSPSLAAGTEVTLLLEQLENFTTYSCSITASVAADTVESNTVQLTPTTDIVPVEGGLEEGDGPAVDCGTSCPVPGEWLSPGDSFNPPQRSIPEPMTLNVPVDVAPAPAGPDGLFDGLYGVASFGSNDDSYPHNMYVTDRSNGSLVQVAETSDGVGSGRVALPAGSFARPSGIVGGPHASHNAYWSASGAQVSDTLYIADTGKNASDGALYRVDPNARLRLPVMSNLSAPLDATGFACFTGSDTTADPKMSNGPAYCVYVAAADGVWRYRVNDGASQLLPNIPGGAESLEPVVYNGAPALAVSLPAASQVRLYSPRSGTLLATYTGFTAPAGLERVGTRLFVADPQAKNIRAVNLATGAVSVVAGAGASGSCANLQQPRDVHWHGVMNGTGGGPDLYVSDSSTGQAVKLRLNASYSCASLSPIWGKPSISPNEAPLAMTSTVLSNGQGYLVKASEKLYTSQGGSIYEVDPLSGTRTLRFSSTGSIGSYAVVGNAFYGPITYCGWSSCSTQFVRGEFGSNTTTVAHSTTTAGSVTLGSDGNVYFKNGTDIVQLVPGGSSSVFVSGLPTGGYLSGGPTSLWFTVNGNTYRLPYTTPPTAPNPWRTGGMGTVYGLIENDGFIWEGSSGILRRSSVADPASFRNMVGGGSGNVDGVGPLARFSYPHGMAFLDETLYFLTQDGILRKVTGAPDFPAFQAPEANTTVGLNTGLVSTLPGTLTSLGELVYLNNKVYAVSGGIVLEHDPLAGTTRTAHASNGSLSRMTTDGSFLYSTVTYCGWSSCSYGILRIHPGSGLADTPVSNVAGFSGLTVGKDAHLYASQGSNLVRFNTNTWQVTTVASPGGGRLTSDNNYIWLSRSNQIDRISYTGQVSALFGNAGSTVHGMAAAGQYVYVATYGGARIERMDAATGAFTAVAGATSPGYFDGDGAQAAFSQVQNIVSDGNGTLYVSDAGNSRLRKVVVGSPLPAAVPVLVDQDVTIDPGTVSTVASSVPSAGPAFMVGSTLYAVSNSAVNRVDKETGALTPLFTFSSYNATGMTSDGTFLYVSGNYCSWAGCNGAVFRYNFTTGHLDTPVGGGSITGVAYGADNKLYVSRTSTLTRYETNRFMQETVSGISAATHLVADSDGVWFIDATSGTDGRLRQVTHDGTVTTVLSGIPNVQRFALAGKYAYVFSRSGSELRRYDLTNGTWTSVAGGTANGFSDGTGAQASFNQPSGIISDGVSTLYVMDTGNSRIRKVVDGSPLSVVQPAAAGTSLSLTGTVSTVSTGYTNMRTSVMHQGELYVSEDTGLYRVDPSTGVRTSVASTAGSPTFPLTSLASDGTFIYGTSNYCYWGCNGYLYRIHPSNGRVESIYTAGSIGGVTVGSDSRLYVSLASGTLVRIDPVTLQVSTLTTTGLSGTLGSITSDSSYLWVHAGSTVARVAYSGTVTPNFASVSGVSGLTSAGTALYATTGHTVVRVDKSSGALSPLAGSTTASAVDGTGTAAGFSTPRQFVSDGTGLYVADSGNGSVRRIQ